MFAPKTPQGFPIHHDPTASKRFFRIFLIPFVLMGLVVSIQAAPILFAQQTVTVTITGIYAPRECRRDRSLIQGRRHRSEGGGGLGRYCGLIGSDHGSFQLPQSERLRFFAPHREALFDQLMVGCTYEIVVAGYGERLAEGRPMTTRAMPTLLRVSTASQCTTET